MALARDPMKKTQFTFFKDTPLTDFQNTIYFNSNAERDLYFLQEKHFWKLEALYNNFNFVRSRGTVDINIPYHEWNGVNYGTFVSDHEPNERFYFYVVKYEYVNDETTRIYMMIDSIMTFCQGRVLDQLTNLSIEREHLPQAEYQKRLWQLKNNDDIIKTYSKKYVKTETQNFGDFHVIFQCKVDLTKNWGDDKNPQMTTSSGRIYDKILSPVNLYICEYGKFNELMKTLAPYPWIAQNISNVYLIPGDFIDMSDLEVVKLNKGDFQTLWTFKNNAKSKNFTLSKLKHTMPDLYQFFNLDMIQDQHLLRSEYMTAEMYSWDGQQLSIDLGKLDPSLGIEVHGINVIGYANKVGFYLKNYQSENATSDISNVDPGAFMNAAIIYDNFDEVPVLVDQYKLALAKNAHQRQLSEDRLLTNRVQNVMDPKANLQDRFFNAANLISNLNPADLFGKFSDEYEFYRDQKAQFADLKLSTPSVSNQSTGNAFQVANGFFGVTLKFSKMSASELKKVKLYYKNFGYQIQEKNTKLADTHSMSIANYVQFSGSWTIPGLDTSFIEQLHAQFENGVRLWHNDHTDNPMNRDLINNKFIS